jgi:hypothetical protein
MAPFTSITGKTVTTPTAFNQLSVSTYGSFGLGYNSIAVSQYQSKMVFSAATGGVFWSTSSDGGTTWLTPALVSGVTSTNYPNIGSLQISADGTRVVFGTDGGYMYYMPWSNATGAPGSPVQMTSCPTQRFICLSMIPDGSKVLAGSLASNLYYAYWNGSGYTYGGDLGSPVGGNNVRLGCSISNDGNGAIVVNATNNQVWYVPLTWNGNTATAGTWVSTGTQGYDSRGLCFLGGGFNSVPSYILYSSSSNSPWYFATWDSTSKAAGTYSSTYSPNGSGSLGGGGITPVGQQAFSPCGPKGNILYFFENYTNGTNSTNFNISKLTLTVS